MSQGMALATANAGGEDLVIEGQTGFIIPVGDPISIEDKIHWFADHPEETISNRPECTDMPADIHGKMQI